MRVDSVDLVEVRDLLPLIQADGMGIEPEVGQWLAARDADGIAGVARLTTAGDHATIDDIWVRPDRRRRGTASALLQTAKDRAGEIWLICDEDMIGFYERRGFFVARAEEFPPALATLYGSRGEWPRASDHVHIAMRSRPISAD